MATFFLFGRYDATALKGLSAARTKKAQAAVTKNGGRIKDMYALLGDRDLVLIVELPSTAAAVKTSVALAKLTGIAFATSPALSVAEFDKLTAKA